MQIPNQPNPLAQTGAESYPPLGRALRLGSAAPTLKAMASNYSTAHSWDELDADACARGAAEIEALRAHIAATAAPGSGVEQDAEINEGDVFRALIKFLLDNDTEQPMDFLRLWNEGSFQECRRDWPEAPGALYPSPPAP